MPHSALKAAGWHPWKLLFRQQTWFISVLAPVGLVWADWVSSFPHGRYHWMFWAVFDWVLFTSHNLCQHSWLLWVQEGGCSPSSATGLLPCLCVFWSTRTPLPSSLETSLKQSPRSRAERSVTWHWKTYIPTWKSFQKWLSFRKKLTKTTTNHYQNPTKTRHSSAHALPLGTGQREQSHVTALLLNTTLGRCSSRMISVV